MQISTREPWVILGVLIDAGVLVVLLQTISGEDIDFPTAVIVAVVAATGTTVLAIGLGIIVAGILGAAGLGIAVSALFGVEIRRSFLIGAVFMVVHIGVGVGFQLMLGS